MQYLYTTTCYQVYFNSSDDENGTDEEDDEVMNADDEESEDEIADDEVELESHTSSMHNSHDSTGMSSYTWLNDVHIDHSLMLLMQAVNQLR